MTDTTYTLPLIPKCPACQCALDPHYHMLSRVFFCRSEDCPFTDMQFTELNLLRIEQWMNGEGPCQPIRTDESEVDERSRELMRHLLDQLAVILKGPNPPDGLHGWQDLPERVQQIIDKIPLREAYIKELERQLFKPLKGS